MVDICCIGHITSDKVVNANGQHFMPGGTAYYFSAAVGKLPLNYLLVTALGNSDIHYADQLREKGITVNTHRSRHTVFFENIYAKNQDERTQHVLQQADSFKPEWFDNVEAKIFHLGPLLANDIATSLIKTLAKKGRVSLDVQGYLRRVENQKVFACDWPEKREALQYVDIVKADEGELQALTNCSTIQQGTETLAGWGVKEIVITNGSKGSAIWHKNKLYSIPAYAPPLVIDATGCGDTYMAGYLFSRIKGDDIDQAGNFAAGMAGLKCGGSGAFNGTESDVLNFMKANCRV